MNEKHKLLYKEIDKILWEDWDPIGVNNIDSVGIRDEYASYLNKVFSMVINNKSSFAEISNYLCMVESDKIGLIPPDRKKANDVAAKILVAFKKIL